MLLQKSNAPAYKGARFDAEGFCLAHSDVRLCRLTPNGRYKIVRKTCYKCGSAALMTDPHAQKTNVHGYRKKDACPRKMPSELLTAKGSEIDILGQKHLERREPADQKVQGKHVEQSPKQRARTLSPRRRSRSLGRNTPRSRSRSKKPLSKSHAMQRVASGTLRELMQIKPPFASKEGEGQAEKKERGRKQNAKKGAGEIDVSNRDRDQTDGVAGTCGEGDASMTCLGVGRCQVHPHVQLSITRTTLGDGQWKILKEVCPHCFPSSKPHPTSAPCKPRPTTKPHPKMGPKMGRMGSNGSRGSDRTHPETPPSTPDTPTKATLLSDAYFARALVISHQQGKRSPAAEAKPVSILRNSTARMAGTSRKRQSSSRLPRAYNEWDALPAN